MPDSHLDVDDPRDREDDGVLIAPAEAALRDAGGRDSGSDVLYRSSESGSEEFAQGRNAGGV
jgi:hypothetical protein